VQGRLAEAERLFEEAMEGRIEALGPGERATLASLKGLGDVRIARGDLGGAERVYSQLLGEHLREDSGTRSDAVAVSGVLAIVLQRQGKLEDAAAVLEVSANIARELLGPEHPNTVTTLSNLGGVLIALEQYEQAVRVHRRGEAGARALWGSDPEGRLGVYLGRLGRGLTKTGRWDEAEQALIEAHARLESAVGTADHRAMEVAGYLAELYDGRHEVEPERGYAERAAIWRGQSQNR